MSINTRLFSRLSSDAGVSALVFASGIYRIYPVLLPQDSAYPAISYQNISNNPINHLSGESNQQNDRVQIDCWAETNDQAHAMADAVKLAMQGSANNFKAIRLTRIDLPYDNDTKLFRVNQDFSIWYT